MQHPKVFMEFANFKQLGPFEKSGAGLEMVFVVGTGRCGTTSMASLLNKIGGCQISHELEPVLLKETSAFLNGDLSDGEMVDVLRQTRNPSNPTAGVVYGDSNQRLSFVIPQLVKAFPNAKVIWLVRDGRDTVSSMYHRYWYHRHEKFLRSASTQRWVENRITGTQTHDMDGSEWSRLSSFGKCCWYWGYTNRLIRESARMANLRMLRVRLEDLPAYTMEIAAFLGLCGNNVNVVPHANRATGGIPGEWQLWSKPKRRTFERFAGAEMDRLYPEWREGWHAKQVSVAERFLRRVRQNSRVAGDYRDGLRRRVALRTRARRLIGSSRLSHLASKSSGP